MNAQWVHYAPGTAWPANAVQGGVYRESGKREPQYIARRSHNSSIIIGYAYQNGPFYGGFHGAEVTYGDFEVLVQNGQVFLHEGF